MTGLATTTASASFACLIPQKTTPFTSQEVDTIKGELKDLLTDPCADFLKKVLDQAKADTHKDLPNSNEVLKIFEAIKGQGGFQRGESNSPASRGKIADKSAFILFNSAFSYTGFLRSIVVAHELTHHGAGTCRIHARSS